MKGNNHSIASSSESSLSEGAEQFFEASETFQSLEDVTKNVKPLKGDLDLAHLLANSVSSIVVDQSQSVGDLSANNSKDAEVQANQEPKTESTTSDAPRPNYSKEDAGLGSVEKCLDNLDTLSHRILNSKNSFPIREVLSDNDILKSTSVKNLDTGEKFPLSQVDVHLPGSSSPLSVELMKRVSLHSLDKSADPKGSSQGATLNARAPTKKSALNYLRGGGAKGSDEKKTIVDHNCEPKFGRKSLLKESGKKFKAFFGKLGVLPTSPSRNGGHTLSEVSQGFIKVKSNKKRIEFSHLCFVQDFQSHRGAVWSLQFSCCGNLLASAGSDGVILVWVLKNMEEYFIHLKAKYNNDSIFANNKGIETAASSGAPPVSNSTGCGEIFKETPFASFSGHSADILDLNWSKNHFLLSSSMDKSVRLWHIAREECLCCFQHNDFVTAIVFHPKDDRYFLSGSLDAKLRLWSIPEKRVTLWNEVGGSGSNLITAANFCLNGKLCVAGTYDGRCLFYDSEKLKYHTQIQISQGHRRHCKISGIQPMPGEDKIMVTSNDSCIRIYDLKEHSLWCKFTGLSNPGSQIQASFSNDGMYILCGSEDNCVYIWNTVVDENLVKSKNFRRDRNNFYEYYCVHHSPVTATVFAPYAAALGVKVNTDNCVGEIMVSADYSGSVVVVRNVGARVNPSRGSGTSNSNNNHGKSVDGEKGEGGEEGGQE